MPDRLDAETPLAFNCPQCGLQLTVLGSRTKKSHDGQPELVRVYMCFAHGSFTFRNSTGLIEGL